MPIDRNTHGWYRDQYGFITGRGIAAWITGGCIVGAALIAVISIIWVNVADNLNESRGRGDAPVGNVTDDPVDVIQFPDRFSNVATACDGHGHRVFVTTKSDQSRFMAVIDDAACN